MPSRQLPRTDDQRTTAKNVCFAKYNGTALADRLIPAALMTSLTAQRTAWNAAVFALPGLLEIQGARTDQAEALESVTRRSISHFIQVLNLAIERGDIPAAQRAYYGLDLGSAAVPPLSSQASLHLWADRIASGEATRIAAGGAALAWPSAAQVAAALAAWVAVIPLHSAALDAYANGQQAIADLRPADDFLTTDLADTVEFNLRDETPSNLRRRAREWGVVYEDDITPAPPTPPTPPVP